MYWTGYEKIGESLEQLGLDEAQFRTLARLPWLVTEKIHGAHFCMITDGTTLSCASRKQLLAPGETFFAYQRVTTRLESQVYELFRQVRALYPQMAELAIYGELFGGAYPHPEVPAVAGLQAVQTGVYYAPDIEFRAFDLAVAGPHLPTKYLDYDQAIALCQSACVPYISPLLIASYQEALEYPIEFSSTLPVLLGLPPLAQENKAEGVVIKPLQAVTYVTQKGSFRPIFKRKIAAFAEDRRFHQAQKWSLPTGSSAFSTLDVLKWEMFNQLTENRIQSALSKIGYRGTREPSRSRQLFQTFVGDVMDELETKQPALLAELTQTERNALLAMLQQETRTLFKQFFVHETRRV